MLLDGLTDYMENQSEVSEQQEVITAAVQEDKDSLAARVLPRDPPDGSQFLKFSHLLTPEEENIMREVIKEYLT